MSPLAQVVLAAAVCIFLYAAGAFTAVKWMQRQAVAHNCAHWSTPLMVDDNPEFTWGPLGMDGCK